MPSNYKKIYAMKVQATDKVVKTCKDIKNTSGIYTIYRVDENGIKFAYIGQAKHLIERLVSHLLGYSQRIDISLKKRKIFDEIKNPYGWHIDYCYCNESELDDKEQEIIKNYADAGWQLYNRTLGSQGQGKVSINDGQSTKGYRDGVDYGYSKAIKDVKEFFDKYLDYCIKDSCKKKDGNFTETALRKFDEFKEMLISNKERN